MLKKMENLTLKQFLKTELGVTIVLWLLILTNIMIISNIVHLISLILVA